MIIPPQAGLRFKVLVPVCGSGFAAGWSAKPFWRNSEDLRLTPQKDVQRVCKQNCQGLHSWLPHEVRKALVEMPLSGIIDREHCPKAPPPSPGAAVRSIDKASNDVRVQRLKGEAAWTPREARAWGRQGEARQA